MGLVLCPAHGHERDPHGRTKASEKSPPPRPAPPSQSGADDNFSDVMLALRDLFETSSGDVELLEELEGSEEAGRRTRRIVYGPEEAAEDRDRCSICLEPRAAGETVVVLRCGHRYHHHCARELFATNKACAVCRSHA